MSIPSSYEALPRLIDELSIYLIPTFISVCLAFFVVYRFNRQKLSVPFFEEQEGNPDAGKKRWMTDSLNFLREGVSKVIVLFRIFSHFG